MPVLVGLWFAWWSLGFGAWGEHGHWVGVFSRFGDVFFDGALDVFEIGELVIIAKRNRKSIFARSARPSNAVHIGLGLVGEFVIEDKFKVVNINAPGRNIGRHQNFETPLFESLQSTLSCSLGFVSVDGRRGNILLFEAVAQPVCTVLGSAKNQGSWVVVLFEQINDEVWLGCTVRFVDKLGDLVNRTRWWGDGDIDGVTQKGLCHFEYLRGHRCREKQGLFLCGQKFKTPLDIVDKPHIKHTVRLIQDKYFDLLNGQYALPHQIKQATRRRHQDIYALFECQLLWVLGHAANQQAKPLFGVSAISTQTLINLQSQLPCRGQYQGPCSFGRWECEKFGRGWIVVQVLQNRNCKCRCLASAGLGTAQDITPLQGRRDGLLLNGGGGFVPLFFDGVQNPWYNVEVNKVHTHIIPKNKQKSKHNAVQCACVWIYFKIGCDEPSDFKLDYKIIIMFSRGVASQDVTNNLARRHFESQSPTNSFHSVILIPEVQPNILIRGFESQSF